MPVEKKLDVEPIRGYRLLEPLGKGGCGEVWKCEAPGGIFKAIKFVYGDLNSLDNDSIRAEDELKAVQRIKSIRHPFLLSMDRVESVAGELIIVTELADQNLDEMLRKHRMLGQPGVPRGDLLAYLREAAEVLDLMNFKFDLQHLDVKPRNLFLVSNHVKVADFGLVSSMAAGNKLEIGAITPLYAAPELFLSKLSRHCDQYSLAITYQEVLTGTLPFDGKNARQLLLQHTQAEPNLAALPAADRPLIARALAKNPEHRFPSCMDLIRALMGEVAGTVAAKAETEEVTNPDLTETLTGMAADTDRGCPHAAPALPPGVLADHIFLEPLGSSPVLDLWKVQSPTGQTRVAKLLYGLGTPSPKFKDNVVRFKALHHPALVPSEVVHLEPGRLILVSDQVQESLRDRFIQCQGLKLPGIRRGELVDYLRAAAEVLDYLYQQHGIQHLGLNPRCLVLDNGWLQLTDFGQAHLLWQGAGQDLARRNNRYAAPELWDKKITRSSDQVSLALVYAEMLTGIHPYRAGKRHEPELQGLSPSDRDVIARALDLDPAKRWPTCTDMVMALEGIAPESLADERARPDSFMTLLQTPRAGKPVAIPGATKGDLHQIVNDIIAAAGGNVSPGDLDDIPVLAADGATLRLKFQAGLPLGAAREKLATFPRQCAGQVLRDDDSGCAILVPVPTGFWGRWFGQQPALELDVGLARVNPASATPIEVAAVIRTLRPTGKQGRQLLEDLGPGILDNLRQTLLVNANKRTQERLNWPHPVTVTPILPNGDKDYPVACRGKDISQSGLGFYLPEELATADVLIELPNPTHPGVALPATLVRAKRCADGWYDVGALFRLPAVRKSAPEACVQG